MRQLLEHVATHLQLQQHIRDLRDDQARSCARCSWFCMRSGADNKTASQTFTLRARRFIGLRGITTGSAAGEVANFGFGAVWERQVQAHGSEEAAAARSLAGLAVDRLCEPPVPGSTAVLVSMPRAVRPPARQRWRALPALPVACRPNPKALRWRARTQDFLSAKAKPPGVAEGTLVISGSSDLGRLNGYEAPRDVLAGVRERGSLFTSLDLITLAALGAQAEEPAVRAFILRAVNQHLGTLLGTPQGGALLTIAGVGQHGHRASLSNNNRELGQTDKVVLPHVLAAIIKARARSAMRRALRAVRACKPTRALLTLLCPSLS
jgi:hypothetical protein